LKNNHIDLINDDAVFFPKQQNKNNTHEGLNSNLQSESQQSINSERDVVDVLKATVATLNTQNHLKHERAIYHVLSCIKEGTV
jgi:hypothetical protein